MDDSPDWIDVRAPLVKELKALRKKLETEASIGRWSFERRLDRIADAVRRYLEFKIGSQLPGGSPRPDIGCSLLYRTLPENCYVGGASKDRRMMDFDARYYSLRSDWPLAITAFSMAYNVEFALNRCESDWWPLTMLGLEHEKKSCETPSYCTASFYCYPIVDHSLDNETQPRSAERVSDTAGFEQSSVYQSIKEDLGRCLIYREYLDDAARNLESIIEDLRSDTTTNVPASDPEIEYLISLNNKLWSDVARSRDGSLRELHDIDMDVARAASSEHLRTLRTSNEAVYDAFKPTLRRLYLKSNDCRFSIRDSKFKNLMEIAEKEPELMSLLKQEESLKKKISDAPQDTRDRFFSFKKFDQKHKKRALKVLHSNLLGQPNECYSTAAIRITCKSSGFADLIARELDEELFLEDLSLKQWLCQVLSGGVLNVGGEDMAEVSLGTLGDLFYAVPTFELGEYYALDRATSFLQALFGSCEVSIFEAHKVKRLNEVHRVKLHLAATTALSDDPYSQHKKFRNAFHKEGRCYQLNLDSNYNIEGGTAEDESQLGKTGLAYAKSLKDGANDADKLEDDAESNVLYRKEDTISRLFRDCGEIESGDTRSFLAFAIAGLENSGLPYGVIRIVSGKEEEFKPSQIRLANAVGRGLGVLWKFFPKNENLEIVGSGDQVLGDFLNHSNVTKFLSDRKFDSKTFHREFIWLLQKLFEDENRVTITDPKESRDRLVFSTESLQGTKIECKIKDTLSRYETVNNPFIRETRNLKGRLIRANEPSKRSTNSKFKQL